jgi:1,2-diacylglycerol 3-alpha-glucosyltransferase
MSEHKIKRVGIMTNTYPPMRNGVSIAVYGLEKALQKKGIEVFIACPAVEGVVYEDNILPLKGMELPKDISADLQLPAPYAKQVLSFFRANKVDIVNTHDTIFGGIEGVFMARELDIPVVHTFHTMIENYNVVNFPAYLSVLRTCIKEVSNNSDLVITPSMKAYKYLLSVPVKTSICQIFNVSYLKEFEYTQTRRFHGLTNPDDFVFLSFARLSPEKNLDLAISILAPIMKVNSKIKLIIAGEGPERGNLENHIKKLGLEKQVYLIGRYAPEELLSLREDTNAKVFLFTSYSENLPTNILEAMNLGLPVVSVNDSSVDYLIQDSVNGFIDREENLTKICQKLIDQPDLLFELSNNARVAAENFLSLDIAQEYLDTFNRVNAKYQEGRSFEERKPLKLERFVRSSYETLKAISTIDFLKK